MYAIAVIPARGGSVGLPGKNVRPLNGVPLVGRSVLAAKRSQTVSEVYVSSDADDILAAAVKYGGIGIRRPADISTSQSSSESALLHVLDEIKASKGLEPDIIVFLQCTSPFTLPDQIDAVVNGLISSGAAAAFAAIEDHGFIWDVGEDGFARGITHDETKPRLRRQDMKPRFRETGAIYAMRVPDFREVGNRFCGSTKLIPIEMPPVEIDDLKDWLVVEAMARIDDPLINRAQAAKPLRAIVTDFDGVHTDDRVIVFQDGQEAVVCSRSDGMGIEFLRTRGVKLLVLSREQNPVLRARAAKLGMEVQHGIADKVVVLDEWRQANSFEWSEIAFVGNDVTDIECMKACGMSFCPQDAHPDAKSAATMVLSRTGGHGALRELTEYVISANLLR